MEKAFNRRNIPNNSEITLSFRRNRLNGLIFRSGMLVSTLKLPCTTFGVQNAMKISFNPRNISNRRETMLSVIQRRVNGRIFRTGVIVSTMNECIVFGV